MTASPEALHAERVGAALDKTRDASSGPYRVNGQSVMARPQFRMSGGHEGSHGTFNVDGKGELAINPQKNFDGALTPKGRQLTTFGPGGDRTPNGFQRFDARNARPGDIITLKDPQVGHRVIVRDTHVLDANDKRALVANWGASADKFLRASGPFQVFKVDSSWGAEDGKSFGGYRCDTWVYDEGSKLWMSYSPHASDGPGVLVSGDGPAGEKVVSAYRWGQS